MQTDYASLVRQLASLPNETEWVEFKHNFTDPKMIGQRIAGLANAAALHRQESAYFVWGVKDKTHEIVGTTFRPRRQKVGNEDLENWITTQLRPKVQFWIREFSVNGVTCVLFEVEAATHEPIAFQGTEYIRVSSYNKKLKDHPEKARVLWRERFARESFESSVAERKVSADDVLRLLRYTDYFELKEIPMPAAQDGILDALCSERIVTRTNGSQFNITSLGAMLFAKDLNDFDSLRRKAPRIVFYKGDNRASTASEREGRRGYASGFAPLVGFLVDALPRSEEIREALRTEMPLYPSIAIRELTANALIHQDFDAVGAGPLIEVFSDRIEFTNPGSPLVDVQRLLDLPAQSRNERLALLMRRLRICEERGTGIDKTLVAVEFHQLPPPDFQLAGNGMKAVLYAPRGFAEMTKAERIRACYQHAGLRAVSGHQMTNETLRKRFSIADSNYATISRVIRDTLDAGLIKPADPSSKTRRFARYLPFWA